MAFVGCVSRSVSYPATNDEKQDLERVHMYLRAKAVLHHIYLDSFCFRATTIRLIDAQSSYVAQNEYMP